MKQGEATRENCINALKSASKDIQLDALCFADIAMLADGKMDVSELDLMVEVAQTLGFKSKEVSDRSKEMMGLEEERKESALTKEEAVLGLVLEMLGVEEREDDSVELEVLESIPLFKEYRRKIDWLDPDNTGAVF